MNLINFPAIAFHPNTEQAIIKTRTSLLEKKYKDYFELFPLYAVNKEKEFSSIKKENYKCIKSASIDAEILYQNVLFFIGNFFKRSNESELFIIPVAIEKKTDDKSLPSVFEKAIKLVNSNDLSNPCQFEPILFKSFQFANCSIYNNQYNLYDNFWIKITS